ncbi:MAG: signal recognition particle-docking protein FtsY [Lachnospiraceae bacterium]|jgi:fused signal recognition particle receptor|nr:signal recognition particle-docking protein FtsY [Lachnospiraceae bacterium]
MNNFLKGLAKTRDRLLAGIEACFGVSKVDEDTLDELEELLITADIGVEATEAIIENVKEHAKENPSLSLNDWKEFLCDSIVRQMTTDTDNNVIARDNNFYEFENRNSVLLIIGVNGVGKTTTIGKLAAGFAKMDKKVIIAAADTFRAAAREQLLVWGDRADVDVIGGAQGSDPASVVFDAIASAKSRKADVLLIDTAGRLHNKKNLMEELKKINRIIEREYPEAYKETLVVLDAVTGQNALLQAKEFKDAADVKGVILTKMDGSAKGGIAVAIASQLHLPVKYIGLGEGIDDLQKFDATSFARALLFS